MAAAALMLVIPAESLSAPHFWPSQPQFHVTLGFRSLAIGDLNRDQRPDLVAVANDDPGTVAVLLGLADGTLAEAVRLVPGAFPSSVVIDDLDRDQDADLVVANASSNDIAVFLGAGDGSFGSPKFFVAGIHPECVAIGDLNRDQISDLVVANAGFTANPGSDKVAVLIGKGDGTFGSPVEYAVGVTPQSVAIADLNGDLLPDVVSSNTNSDDLAVLLGNGDGTLGAATYYEVGQSPRGVVIGDLNGDQVPDLVVANSVSDNIAVLPGVGNGTFGAISFIGAIDSPFSLVLGDLNRDSVLDIVSGNNRSLAVMRGVGDGTFFSPRFYSLSGFASQIALGDLNGDHVTDLAIAHYYNLTLFPGLGDGAFAVPSAYDAGKEPIAVVGDLNGDRIPDLAVVDGESQLIYVLLGVGNGTFRLSDFYDGVGYPSAVAIGDLNRDGALDLAVSTTFQPGNWILLGDGEGGFGFPQSIGGTDYQSSLAIGDLNRDQNLDLAVGGRDSVGVFLGNGDGTFNTTSSYWTGSGATSVAIGDLSGDQILDLAVANNESGNVGVLIGLGDGTFEAADHYPMGRSPQCVVIRDLNRDGIPDLTATNLDFNPTRTLSVLLGTGSGRFDPARFYEAGGFPGVVNIEDFDGDLVLDAAVISGQSESLAILKGAGDGTFGRPAFYATGNYPLAMATGDFNGDQAQDIAVGGSPVSILLGFRPPVLTGPTMLHFPAVTVGDTVALDVVVSNAGDTRVPITNVVPPSPEMRVGVSLPIYIDSGATVSLPILLAPRQRLDAAGELHVHSVAPPAIAMEVDSDIRPLTISSRRDPAGDRVELGQEISVMVTPDPQVHVERGEVHYSVLGIGGQFSIPLNPNGQGFEATIPSRHVTEDGLDYYISVENSSVFATDPPGAPDSTFAVRVNFTSFALPNSGAFFVEGRAIQVITNFTAIDSGNLYFRRGGERDYLSVPIDTEQPIPVATIPDVFVGPRGVEYWMEIVRGSEPQTDPSGAESGGPPHVIRTTVEALNEGHDHGGGEYRMASIPLDFPQSLTLEALLSDQAAFGPYDPLQWRSFRYAEVDSEFRYVELSETTLLDVHRVIPGKAFWLLSRDTGRIDAAPIAGTSTPTDEPFRVPIPSGWAQIGNPFLFPIAWDSVQVEVRSDTLTMFDAESSGHLEPPVAWRPNHGYETDVRILAPFDGYWVRNTTDTTVCLLIPPREAPSEKARPRTTPAMDRVSWAIAIRAAAGAVDDANLAGMSPDAATDWDSFDRSEPPMSPGESISLYFPHRSWEKHPGLYSTDIRGAYEPLSALRELAPHLPDAEPWGHLWRFDVAKNSAREGIADEVRLEFAGLDGVPEEASILLVDRRLQTVVDLRKDARYAFTLRARAPYSDEASARFLLLVGSGKFRDAYQGQLPAPPVRTALYPGYPNPFNPSTIIRYDIAHAGPVTIGIFDVRGAMVKILVEGRREPGRYEIGWNGDDQRGKTMASGIYFCRLTSEHFSEARKLLMIR